MSSIRTVLITGGAGYVGGILTKKLENEGYNVKVVDSLVFGNDGISSLINEKRIEFFNQDHKYKTSFQRLNQTNNC